MKSKASLLRTFLMASSLTLCGVEAFGSICNVINPAEISFDQSSLNFDSIQYVYVSDDDVIELETCEGSLVSDINNLFTIDNCLYVHSHNSLHVFDFTGEYMFDISENDSIMEDGNTISNVYERNGRLYIDNGKDLLCFSRDGELLSSQNLANYGINDQNSPVLPYPVQKGPNVSDNMYACDMVTSNHSEPIPGVPGDYQICDGSLYFVFQVSSAETCLCRYNLTNHQSKLYHFNIKNRNLIQRSFFKIIDGVAYIEFRNEEDNTQNPYLYMIRLSDL